MWSSAVVFHRWKYPIRFRYCQKKFCWQIDFLFKFILACLIIQNCEVLFKDNIRIELTKLRNIENRWNSSIFILFPKVSEHHSFYNAWYIPKIQNFSKSKNGTFPPTTLSNIFILNYKIFDIYSRIRFLYIIWMLCKSSKEGIKNRLIESR